MSVRKAGYAASFDPITNGHLDIIARAASLYDQLLVIVAVDPRKTYTFSAEERADMVRITTAHLSNVAVEMCVGRYVVHFAKAHGAQVIIRGLRNISDMEAESTLAHENRGINQFVETIWLPCLPELTYVSSSMVKSHVGADPDWEKEVSRSVPAVIVVRLREKFIMNKARKHWNRLMAEYGNPRGHEQIFQELVKRYSEANRKYHDLDHIVMMLDEHSEVVGGESYDKSAVEFGIWFHDAVYDPQSKSNEGNSAVLAENALLRLGFKSFFRDMVKDAIKATDHVSSAKTPEARMLIDLDLAILGQSKERFDAYEVAVRQEYAHVPDAEFRAARLAILQSFLERSFIYQTEFFEKKYGEAARRNLEMSVERLRE